MSIREQKDTEKQKLRSALFHAKTRAYFKYLVQDCCPESPELLPNSQKILPLSQFNLPLKTPCRKSLVTVNTQDAKNSKPKYQAHKSATTDNNNQNPQQSIPVNNINFGMINKGILFLEEIHLILKNGRKI